METIEIVGKALINFSVYLINFIGGMDTGEFWWIQLNYNVFTIEIAEQANHLFYTCSIGENVLQFINQYKYFGLII